MIEMGKKYRTRDGRDVRIYAIEPDGIYPVHGAIKTVNGFWCSRMWDHSGKMAPCNRSRQPEGFLIEVKPEVTVRRYLCVHSSGEMYTSGTPFETLNEWRCIGTIDITHDGEKLIRVEIAP